MMLPSFLVHKRFFKLWRTAVDSQWTNIAIQKSRIVVLFIILGPSTASGQSLPGKLSVFNILAWIMTLMRFLEMSVNSIDIDNAQMGNHTRQTRTLNAYASHVPIYILHGKTSQFQRSSRRGCCRSRRWTQMIREPILHSILEREWFHTIVTSV